MKPVLFIDWHGTLCQDPFWRNLPDAVLQKIKIFEFDHEHIADRWMRGEFTSEEINERVAAITGLEYQHIWDTFVDNCRTMTVSFEILDRIKQLRNRFHTVLITDNMDCFDRFTIPALHLDRYFDKIVNSYNEKISKNDQDGKLFKTVIEQFYVTFNHSILIDDSQSTCKLFQQLGGTAYHVTPITTLDNWIKLKIDNM